MKTELNYYIVDRGSNKNLIELMFFGNNTKNKTNNKCLSKSMRFAMTTKGIYIHSSCRNGNYPKEWNIDTFGVSEALELIKSSGVTFKSGKVVQGTITIELNKKEECNMDMLLNLVNDVRNNSLPVSKEVNDKIILTYLDKISNSSVIEQPCVVNNNDELKNELYEIKEKFKALASKYNDACAMIQKLSDDNKSLNDQINALNDIVSEYQEEDAIRRKEEYEKSVKVVEATEDVIIEDASVNIEIKEAEPFSKEELKEIEDDIFSEDTVCSKTGMLLEDAFEIISELNEEGEVSDDVYEHYRVMFYGDSSLNIVYQVIEANNNGDEFNIDESIKSMEFISIDDEYNHTLKEAYNAVQKLIYLLSIR